MKYLLILSLFALILNISKADEPTAFAKKHPDDAPYYVKMLLTSTEAEIHHARITAEHQTSAFERGVHVGCSGKLTKAQAETVSRSAALDYGMLQDEVRLLDEIKSNMQEGSLLYLYEYRKGGDGHSGYLLLKDGDIARIWKTVQWATQKDGSIKREI